MQPNAPDESEPFLPAVAEPIEMLRSLWRIRLVEEAIAERYSEQEMRCPIHLSIGQEAAAVGVMSALRRDDSVFSTHRCHAHYIAKGGSIPAMIAELYGKKTGCTAGRGGSMHLMDHAAGLVASVPIVGSGIPLAVGSALAQQMDGEDAISVAFLGDASVEEGVFHESANFASLRRLPIVFVCENNLYSVYTHLSRRQPARPIEDLAGAHRIPAHRIDGNDAVAVYEAACAAVSRARCGDGPTFLQLDTYRWREHCGPNFDNHLGYRTSEEYESWRRQCPLDRFSRRLRGAGLISEPEEKALVDELRGEIDRAFEFALASPFPDTGDATSGVYAPAEHSS